jgi:hypothetical protein
MKNIKVMFRYRSEGRKAFTPAPGSIGMDRSIFDVAAPTQAGALAIAGALSLGRPLSIWADADTEEARDAAVNETIAKITVAQAMLGTKFDVKLVRA